ncbi:MAG: hypothetical protein ACLQQ4_04015 [Bacteroidia bacterium]
MTHSEAVAEAGKHNINDYKHRGVKMYGITFFPVKIEAMKYPGINGENYEVMVELEVLSGDNIRIPIQRYFALL